MGRKGGRRRRERKGQGERGREIAPTVILKDGAYGRRAY